MQDRAVPKPVAAEGRSATASRGRVTPPARPRVVKVRKPRRVVSMRSLREETAIVPHGERCCRGKKWRATQGPGPSSGGAVAWTLWSAGLQHRFGSFVSLSCCLRKERETRDEKA